MLGKVKSGVGTCGTSWWQQAQQHHAVLARCALQVVAVPHFGSSTDYDALDRGKVLTYPLLLTHSALESKKVQPLTQKILKEGGAMTKLVQASLLELDKEAAVRSPCRGFWHIEDVFAS